MGDWDHVSGRMVAATKAVGCLGILLFLSLVVAAVFFVLWLTK